jgi:hypothetical protein
MGHGSSIPQQPGFARNEILRLTKLEIPDTQLNFMVFGADRFHQFAMVSCAQKCFFYTDNNYFGTAPDPLPDSIQAGDMVAVVSGLEMPLVLRPVEGGHRLISHVYVHGMMYGELWPEGQDQLQNIALV